MRVLELHARLKVVQRSKGHCATAAAAYRAAERILDERTGQWKDYRKKQGVEHTALLLPDNAPDWAHDRSRLWNAAEKKENRSNSQTARELELSFPHEMNKEQRRFAGYTVAQTLVERYGAGVDIAFHAPSSEGDQRNHHAHILFTVRRFDEKQADGWAKKKDRILDDRSKAKGAEHSKGALETMWLRERVAGVMNDICAENGLDVYTEHLSFEDRGLHREPTQHLGPHASDMERSGQDTRIGDKNREIKAANDERARDEIQLNIIDLAIERERRREASQKLTQREEEKLRITPPSRREVFYERIQGQRTAMLYSQKLRYGEQEQKLHTELTALHKSTEQTGFVRFWHRVTGRRESELRRIEELQAEHDRIAAVKAAQAAIFEQNRQRQLEALKAAEAKEMRDRARRYSATEPEQQPETEHYSAKERAQANIAALADRKQAEHSAGRERSPARSNGEQQHSQSGSKSQAVAEFEKRRAERQAKRDRDRADDLDIER